MVAIEDSRQVVQSHLLQASGRERSVECGAVNGKEVRLAAEYFAILCSITAFALARRCIAAAGRYNTGGVRGDSSGATDDAFRRRFYGSSDGDPNSRGPYKYRATNGCRDTKIVSTDSGSGGWMAHRPHIERYDGRPWR